MKNTESQSIEHREQKSLGGSFGKCTQEKESMKTPVRMSPFHGSVVY